MYSSLIERCLNTNGRLSLQMSVTFGFDFDTQLLFYSINIQCIYHDFYCSPESNEIRIKRKIFR